MRVNCQVVDPWLEARKSCLHSHNRLCDLPSWAAKTAERRRFNRARCGAAHHCLASRPTAPSPRAVTCQKHIGLSKARWAEKHLHETDHPDDVALPPLPPLVLHYGREGLPQRTHVEPQGLGEDVVELCAHVMAPAQCQDANKAHDRARAATECGARTCDAAPLPDESRLPPTRRERCLYVVHARCAEDNHRLRAEVHVNSEHACKPGRNAVRCVGTGTDCWAGKEWGEGGHGRRQGTASACPSSQRDSFPPP